MLKNKWQNANCSVFFRLLESAASAAKIPERDSQTNERECGHKPVVVVPMLDPSVNGYIRSRDITPMPAKGVSADVNMELLWTRIVIIQPTRIAI